MSRSKAGIFWGEVAQKETGEYLTETEGSAVPREDLVKIEMAPNEAQRPGGPRMEAFGEATK